jgi:hypothetical protein
MLTDAERARKKERLRLEKLRQTSGAYDDSVMREARKDTTSRKGKKQAKARKEVTEALNRQAKRKLAIKKSQAKSQTIVSNDRTGTIDYRESGMTKSTVNNRTNK